MEHKNTQNETELQKGRELGLLKAELAILRSNIRCLEKENEMLKREKSRAVLEKIDVEQEIRKRMETQLKDEFLSEKQRKLFKANEKNEEELNLFIKSSGISPKFILDQAIRKNDLFSEDTLQKLRFFKDYFFDDFFQIPDEMALSLVDFYSKESTKLFITAYSLFCCKRVVFQKFAPKIFEDNSFLNSKIEILEQVSPDWILILLDGPLGNFIRVNRRKLLSLVAEVSEKCPSYLIKVFSKEFFNELLENTQPIGNKIIYNVITQKIEGFIDHSNLHLLPKQFLILLNPDFAFDVI